MANEVIQLPQESAHSPVTQQDVENQIRQRELLKRFVSSQMIEADFSNSQSPDFAEGDYGIIPGTKKRTLLKPGAEKLQKLFNLGCRVKLVDKEIDRAGNFAYFIYKAEVYHLKSGVVIAECEGLTNSQEVKYKERTVCRKKKTKTGKEVSEWTKEATPVADILNTLMKMAQKRAIVGATILATGASDYFTSDIETPEEAEAQGLKTKVEDAPQTKKKANNPLLQEQEGVAPECCGKPMMISKYPDKDTGEIPFYCVSCKKKVARS